MSLTRYLRAGLIIFVERPFRQAMVVAHYYGSMVYANLHDK